jgi:integrase
MGDYVFKSRQSNKLSKSAFNSIIVKWVNVSGIQKQKNYKITAHTFRHTFITLCIRANIPDTKIIEYTGHKDINSLDVYKHLCTTDYNDIINAVNIGSNTLKRVI